jgi:hypothetical protein
LIETLPVAGQPQSAVHGLCATYGLPILCVAFVIVVTFGLVSVPQRADPSHCGECGYDLHGLREPRCPECGTPFDPKEVVGNGGEAPPERQNGGAD